MARKGKISIFDGTNKLSVRSWLSELETYLQSNPMCVEDALEFIPCHLEGIARDWWYYVIETQGEDAVCFLDDFSEKIIGRFDMQAFKDESQGNSSLIFNDIPLVSNDCMGQCVEENSDLHKDKKDEVGDSSTSHEDGTCMCVQSMDDCMAKVAPIVEDKWLQGGHSIKGSNTLDSVTWTDSPCFGMYTSGLLFPSLHLLGHVLSNDKRILKETISLQDPNSMHMKEWDPGDPKGELVKSFPPPKGYGMFEKIINSFFHLIHMSVVIHVPRKEFWDHDDECIKDNSPKLIRARRERISP
ncbi:hypothetical protein KI387_039458 [Taxus chinensis]|uniref:Uncharacterized protein n=1 Tax=Taxus chinensis TaxID=29808 RepID=A0AA38FBK3_TAXCH|nr:hypothetical protein KI387_039458 [Taxus chinensis]